MMSELTLVSAFLVGLLGSTHCLGMCGGIVSALTLGVNEGAQRSLWSMLPYTLAYHAGRIASYAVAGGLLGYAGAHLLELTPQALPIGRWISVVFLIALGLYLTGWWMGLSMLERAGGGLWRRLQPLSRRLLPVNHPAKALLLGLLWGWLPCGMVYAALGLSLGTGGTAAGATLMTAFGLGTLPLLVVAGVVARRAGSTPRSQAFRRIVGVALLGMGLYAGYSLITVDVHRHATAQALGVHQFVSSNIA